jgi:hypothetical protein
MSFQMLWGAHIAGIPVEETVLGFAPVIALMGGIAGAKLRERVSKRRARSRRREGIAGGAR